MRRELEVLKQKLDNQEIVNDGLIRRIIKKNVKNITLRYRIVALISLLMIPYSYWAFVVLNELPVGIWVATVLMMLVVFAYTIIIGRCLKRDSLFSTDMLSAYKQIARARKLDSDWLKIGIPLILIWLGYFGYELYCKYGVRDVKQMIAIYAVCALVGAAIGLKIHFGTQSKYSEILRNIEDMAK